MSKLQSGAILLFLAIPFGLYVAWQVQAATGASVAASAPPSDKGVPAKDQLAAAKAKAEKWAGDVKWADTVALQYRPKAADAGVEDADCKALARSAADRSANLTDLEKFLTRVDKPDFAGALKARFLEWQKIMAELAGAEQAVDGWLRNALPVAVDGPAAATQALNGFEALVADYEKGGAFADRAKVGAWRIEARVKVLEALEEAAKVPYDEVLKLSLPLPSPRESKLVEKAVGTPAAIREQVKLVKAELARADEAGRVIPDRVQKAAGDAAKRAEEWATKEQLLALFADPDLLTDPNKAAEWLPKMQTQFARSQSKEGKELIRKKVTEFCNAYVPKAGRLDARVTIKGEDVARSGVTIEYDGKPKGLPLTDHPGLLNEFNFTTLHTNFDKIVWDSGGKFTGTKENLKPTPGSLAARDYTLARATVTKWTVEAVNQLKKACEGEDERLQQKRRDLADLIVGAEPVKDPLGKDPGSAWNKENTRIWTRLSALAAGIEKHPALFEPNP